MLSQKKLSFQRLISLEIIHRLIPFLLKKMSSLRYINETRQKLVFGVIFVQTRFAIYKGTLSYFRSNVMLESKVLVGNITQTAGGIAICLQLISEMP